MQSVFNDFTIMMDNIKVEKKERKIKREPNKLVIINEEELIRQVQIRPILYDKSLKSYRKSALRNQSWNEIGQILGSPVEECRKRWRSLRDAFSKHFKIMDKIDDSKKKKWIFYDQMLFIAPYLEYCKLELDDSHIVDFQDNSHESIIVHEQEDPDEEINETHTYKHKIDERVHCHKSVHDSSTIDMNEENAFITDIFESSDVERPQYQTLETLEKKDIPLNSSSNNLSVPESHLMPTDEYGPIPSSPLSSDDKFLLSCSPILKRLSTKKNALARFKIQEILYNIEFGDS